ncbi:hypothetical protein ACWXVL_02395 [Mycoplasma sp. 128]|uniref:hypothetical protein n=1 Tax=Mycoplasma sp. 3341 TaxID=3447506 RepID=UPI003F657763
MQKEYKLWCEFYGKNRKALRQIKKYQSSDENSEFYQDIKINEGVFVAQTGYGYNKFNEATIRGLAHSYANFLKSKYDSTQPIRILLASDGSDAQFSRLINEFGQVLMASNIKVYLFEKSAHVSKDFAFYVMQKTKDLHNLVFFSDFSQSHKTKALYFFDERLRRFFDEDINEIYNYYLQNVNIFLTPSLLDDFFYLKVDMLMEEYVSEILKLQIRPFDKKELKIKLVNNPASQLAVQKILGKMDYSYSYLKTKKTHKNATLIFNKDFLKFKKSNYKHDNFLFVFNPEIKVLNVYQRKFLLLYKKINPNDLIMAYLDFVGSQMKQNQKSLRYEEIYISPFLRNNIYKLDEKYYGNIHKKIFLDKRDFLLIRAQYFMSFDEDGAMYVKKPLMSENNAVMFFVTMIEMLNYFKSQNKSIKQVFKEQNKLYGNEIVDIFRVPINRKFVKDFLEILVQLKKIANRYIFNQIPMKDYRSYENQYVYKVVFDNSEWLGIKFDKNEDELVFYNQVLKNKKDIAQTKKFFKKVISLLNKKDKKNISVSLSKVLSSKNG